MRNQESRLHSRGNEWSAMRKICTLLFLRHQTCQDQVSVDNLVLRRCPLRLTFLYIISRDCNSVIRPNSVWGSPKSFQWGVIHFCWARIVLYEVVTQIEIFWTIRTVLRSPNKFVTFLGSIERVPTNLNVVLKDFDTASASYTRSCEATMSFDSVVWGVIEA